MKFKESPYYDKKFLGREIYENINDNDKIYTIQEYFGINDAEKEYHIKKLFKDYKLKVFENYYELDCQKSNYYLSLVFDKPVHIIGQYCIGIFAPEIVIKNKKNTMINKCVSNNIIVNNGYDYSYFISCSKFHNVHFYNKKIELNALEADNFFIFDKDLCFHDRSNFLEDIRIKCFGSCKNLKSNILKDEDFKNRIIHIE